MTAFARQAIAMTWDYPEVNPFAGAAGDLDVSVASICEALGRLEGANTSGHTMQLDATSAVDGVPESLVVTDPPYYDNVGYADLSDFFYVWLRRTLGGIYQELFSTLLTPKTGELIANPYRFGGSRAKADEHFEDGFQAAFLLLRNTSTIDYPLTLYYAFRQAESSGDGPVSALASTGWQTMLTGLLEQGFQIVGTWPMRTEGATRPVASGANALASSIVLVCRPRPESAPAATFKQFQPELAREVPAALSVMTGRERQHAGEPWVDPIDLRQAAIGPGMAVYSRYSRVQKADGDPLSVREALIEINEAIDRYFDEMEGAWDKTTRFCLHWYRESGFEGGQYGRAEILAKATDTDPERIEKAGLLLSDRGKVRLFRPSEYREQMDDAVSAWELCHRLVGALDSGEEAAARLYNRMPGLAEEARDLAYRLYLEAEKKGRAEDALGYNALVASWTDIRKKAVDLREETQGALPV